MKWISDADEQRIRDVFLFLGETGGAAAACVLGQVLANIQRLGQEQPHPAPRIRELSEAEQRVFYPERHRS